MEHQKLKEILLETPLHHLSKQHMKVKSKPHTMMIKMQQLQMTVQHSRVQGTMLKLILWQC
jgi:hypothetical protein